MIYSGTEETKVAVNITDGIAGLVGLDGAE
jgi:hypothetical protein